jgi:hypothetical protein
MAFVDMAGWVMKEHGVPESRLKVIEKAGVNKHNKVLWLCECSCEKHTRLIVIGSHLRNGNTKSCGCLNREKQIENGHNTKKYNTYDISGEYGIGWTINNNEPFYFDLKYYVKIKEICWSDYWLNWFHRLMGWIPEMKRTISFHQYIGFANCDHIDRNELNNLENNLRESTQQQNCMNRSIQKNNTSGVIGVNWDNLNNKWVARINSDKNKRINLGNYNDFTSAVIARLQAEVKYYGEFAPQRHLFEQYGIATQQY